MSAARNRRRPALRAACLGALVLAGCASRAKEPTTAPVNKPICAVDTSINGDAPLATRTFPVQYWFVLMLGGYRSTGDLTLPVKDCRGLPVELRYDGCSPEAVGQAEVAARLTASDLFISNLGDARRLVWVTVSHLPDGQAQGPVALAEVTKNGIAVRAMGTLRAYPERVKLRLTQMGTHNLLVAEGEHCPGKLDPASCDRGIRVMPLVGTRFENQPLSRADGGCLGASLIASHAAGRRPSGETYDFESAVDFQPDGISIQEQLTIRPATTKREREVSAAFVTKVQAARRVVLRGDALVSTDEDLLSKWLARGSAGASDATER
jgi:hypothetical protein